MAKRVHSQRADPTVPYSLAVRRERSRELAQKRRTTYKSIMSDLAQELPFSRDVISQVDYNSRLRLALCYFRMKSLSGETGEVKKEVMEKQEKPAFLQLGMLQDFMTEALDGFIMVALSDGMIVYLSESIHKHLGLFQSEHIGFSMYDLILEEDHQEVKMAITKAETDTMSRLSTKGNVSCSFFCRMKCSRFKIANTVMKSPGYKLVFVSGHFKMSDSDPYLVSIVRPVSPPSILEIRMEGNMYVTHYSLDFKCTFYDGRLRHLLGYSKNDLIGHIPFEFHHHDDTDITLNCSREVESKGEGLSGYYRFMSQFGFYIWLQSRATLMFDSRTGKPSYIVCMNFVISKEKGERDLVLRQAITAGESNLSENSSRSYDPFPILSTGEKSVNPFDDDMSPQTSPVSVEPSSTNFTTVLSPDGSNSNSSPVSCPSSVSPGSISHLPTSVSPHHCKPDSTSEAVLQSGFPSSCSTGRQSDLGYYSSGMLSMESTSNLTPGGSNTSSPQQALNSLVDHPQVLESPISVFSPDSITLTTATQMTPQQQQSVAMAMTYSPTLTTANGNSPTEQSSPAPSVLEQYVQGSPTSSMPQQQQYVQSSPAPSILQQQGSPTSSILQQYIQTSPAPSVLEQQQQCSPTTSILQQSSPAPSILQQSSPTSSIPQDQQHYDAFAQATTIAGAVPFTTSSTNEVTGVHSPEGIMTPCQLQSSFSSSQQTTAANQILCDASEMLPDWNPHAMSQFIKQEPATSSCYGNIQSVNMSSQADAQQHSFVNGTEILPPIQLSLPNLPGVPVSSGVASVIVIDDDTSATNRSGTSSNSLPVLSGDVLDFIEQLEVGGSTMQMPQYS